ncbi:MAG: nucleotidyltransferase domain-containing protein [Anaerolineales bacterium]|nr:nucleotidyltransferase domain-containing protein [Anaerolineales bacterium]
MTTEYARLYPEITRRIVAAANPVKVILFGSRSRGTTHPGSDVDLLVIERDPVSARQEAIRLRQLLRDLEIPIDIIVVGQSFAERYGDIPGSVLYPALREGMVLYG